MKFWEAIRFIEEGRKVRCKEWSQADFACLENIQWFLHMTASGYWNKDWELYEEPEQLLNFQQVIQGLKEEKKFKRKGWDVCDAIGVDYKKYPQSLIANCASPSLFTIQDFEAADWIEVK